MGFDIPKDYGHLGFTILCRTAFAIVELSNNMHVCERQWHVIGITRNTCNYPHNMEHVFIFFVNHRPPIYAFESSP